MNKYFFSTIITLFFLFSFYFSYSQSISTVVQGGCDKLTVVSQPLAYTNLYNQGVQYGEGCQAAVFGFFLTNPMKVRHELQKKSISGVWEYAGQTLYGLCTFPISLNGTYRVKTVRPSIRTWPNCPNGIKVYNANNQWVGYVGEYNATPPNVFYSNEQLVGPTNASDISYFFVDDPETGSESTYDFGEIAIMDASASRNYDLWWVAIFESGPTFNRYAANGWTTGTVSQFNLTEFWQDIHEGANFETFHSYIVQFVVENWNCRNGVEYLQATSWNNLDRTFFICPAGTGCRFGIENIEINLIPNPASTYIRFENFNPAVHTGYRMTISNLQGQLVRNVDLDTAEVNIEDLTSGMYIVNVWH